MGSEVTRAPKSVVEVKERIWHIPPDYCANANEFAFPGWESQDFFGNDNPVVIEYCSGNGHWIVAKAANEPQRNWLAVERKFFRVQKIAAKVRRQKLANLFILYGEAYAATRGYFPTGKVDEIYINFPDPWPKNRHAKHRLICASFLDELYRILKNGGKVTFVTDDVAYSEWTIREFLNHKGFDSLFPFPFFASHWEDYGSSCFEELWRQQGRAIRYHSFVKL